MVSTLFLNSYFKFSDSLSQYMSLSCYDMACKLELSARQISCKSIMWYQSIFIWPTALPILDKVKDFWIRNEISCQVNRSNPLPKISWKHQNGLCLINNPQCLPDSSSWQDTSSTADIIISPVIEVATKKSTLKIPKDYQSSFFRCEARNERGADFHVMSFFSSGELT